MPLHKDFKEKNNMSFQEISYDHRGETAWIFLDRPDEMNSINTQLAIELDDALHKAETDDSVRVLVISGRGKAFCAGADLKSFLAGQQNETHPEPDFLDLITKTLNHLRNFPKPVIAAVNGMALAGGLELVMCCDLVIAAESAKLGDAHSNFGMFPGAGGAAVLPRRIGLTRAKHLLFTGDFLSASEMKEYGLVNQVVPEEELEAAVQTLADKLSAKSPLVLARMKEVANQSLDQAQDAALRHELLNLRAHMRSYDMMEGLAAFKEKRKPKFKGE
jgi:enoyl-CoA hydratase